MNDEQMERLDDWLEQIHGVLERIEARLEELTRETSLQRDTLDSVLVNTMELVDATTGAAAAVAERK